MKEELIKIAIEFAEWYKKNPNQVTVGGTMYDFKPDFNDFIRWLTETK